MKSSANWTCVELKSDRLSFVCTLLLTRVSSVAQQRDQSTDLLSGTYSHLLWHSSIPVICPPTRPTHCWSHTYKYTPVVVRTHALTLAVCVYCGCADNRARKPIVEQIAL